MAKELTKAQTTAVAEVYNYGEDSRTGFEGTTLNDLAIPFINLLQPMSPEVVDQTVPGAQAGQLLNSVTKEILAMPLVVIPLYKEDDVWVEWKPRNQGGGIVARHAFNDPIVQAAITKNGGSRIPPKDADGKRIPFKTPQGTELVETYYVYCLILNEEGEEVTGYCVLSFSSTKITVRKKWMTSMYTIKGNPPLFANRSKLSTTREKSDGGTYFNFSFMPFSDKWSTSLIPPGSPLLQEAKDFRQMILDGLAKPAFDSVEARDDDAVEGTSSRGRSSAPVDGDDDIPF